MFKTVLPEEINENTFKLIGADWMLITAGNRTGFNTMTASWGTFGILWHKPVAICFIRPQRYTIEFIEKSEYFTLSFFEDKYREVLNFCGSKSGRDYDKIKETGLKPLETVQGNIYFEQSKLMVECRKIYSDFIKPELMLEQGLNEKIYPNNDHHKFFIGEIMSCLKK